MTTNLSTTKTMSRAAYGEAVGIAESPLVQINFIYGLQNNVNTTVYGSGTISAGNSVASIRTGTTISSLAQLLSKRTPHYNAGQGNVMRFSAVFDTPIAGTTQICGVGDQTNGYFFGYNGTNFGILHRKGGALSIYTLQYTAAATAAGTITITLNSISLSLVFFDSSTSIHNLVATTIAQVWTSIGWNAYADGDSVHFISTVAEPKPGTFSFNAGTTGSSATMIKVKDGVNPTDTWISQNNWNRDKADSTGKLTSLNYTYGNVYQISYQWLGFGTIFFYIEDPLTGFFEIVHQILYSGTATTPSTFNSHLPAMFFVDNGSTTSDITLKTSSIGLFTQGHNNELVGSRFAVSNFINGGSLKTGSYTNILAIRNNVILSNTLNRIETLLLTFSIGYDSTKACLIRLIYNPVFSDPGGSGLTWTLTGNNAISYSTDLVTLTGPVHYLTVSLNKSDSVNIVLQNFEIRLQPTEVIAIGIQPIANVTADVSASLVGSIRI